MKKSPGKPVDKTLTVYFWGMLVPESEVINIGNGIHGPSAQWINRYDQTMHDHWKNAAARHPEGQPPWDLWQGDVAENWGNEGVRGMQSPGAGPSNQAEQPHPSPQN
jgi:hypothetical protein